MAYNETDLSDLRASVDAIREALNPRGLSRTVADLCAFFLDWSGKHNSPKTVEGHRFFLRPFVDFAVEGRRIGDLRVGDLRPYHVEAWLDSRPRWSRSTRRGAITSVKRVINESITQGLLEQNPLAKLKKPPCAQRERVLDDGERARLLANYAPDDPFRDFLEALLLTGARPGEIAAIEAAQVSLDDGTWTMQRHKTRDRQAEPRPRVIYLVPRMVEISRALVERHPSGPIFRNSRGKPWTRNAWRCRFRRVRVKLDLGDDVCAYGFRHGYATDALERGVPEATVAELLGHTDTKMIHRHYSKLRTRTQHLRDMAAKAVGAGQDGTAGRKGGGRRRTSK